MELSDVFSEKNEKKFGSYRKKYYLCTRIREKTRFLTSAFKKMEHIVMAP